MLLREVRHTLASFPSDADCLRVALLDFEIPRGLRLQISSLAAPNFATSYTLGSVGVVDGSVSYLYSSLPLRKEFKSSRIDLHHVIRGYKHLQELRRPDENWWWEVWHAGRRVDRRGTHFVTIPTSLC